MSIFYELLALLSEPLTISSMGAERRTGGSTSSMAAKPTPLLDWSPKSKSKPSVQDPAKFFRRERPATNAPRSITAHDLPISAEFYVREGLQNHYDATRDPDYLKNSDARPCVVTYHWVTHVGKEKTELLKGLGIDVADLAARADSLNEENDPGGTIRDAVKLLCKKDRPLTLLYAVEDTGSGMYHSKFGDDEYLPPSRLYAATLDINESDKHTTAGGSYGQGKTALFAASKLRMNYVYTDYSWHSQSQTGAALLGISCWPQHRKESSTYSGYAYVSDGKVREDSVDAPRPFFDEAAHSIAVKMGFARRQTPGTSILIVEPDFEVDKLEKAVLANWWPALLSGQLVVKLKEHNKPVRTLDPRSGEMQNALQGFCEAYDALKAGAANDELTSSSESAFHARKLGLGDFGAACIDLGADAPKTMVYTAKMREIGLIVEYQRVNAPAPKGKELFGCFEASAEAGEILRTTENKGHTTWQKSGSDNASKKVREVEIFIKDQLTTWSKTLRGNSSSDFKSSSLLASLLRDFMNTPGENRGRKPAQAISTRPKPNEHDDPFLDDPQSVQTGKNWTLAFRVKAHCTGSVYLRYAVDNKASNLDVSKVEIFHVPSSGTTKRHHQGPQGYIFQPGVQYLARAVDVAELTEATDRVLDTAWLVLLK